MGAALWYDWQTVSIGTPGNAADASAYLRAIHGWMTQNRYTNVKYDSGGDAATPPPASIVSGQTDDCVASVMFLNIGPDSSGRTYWRIVACGGTDVVACQTVVQQLLGFVDGVGFVQPGPSATR